MGDDEARANAGDQNATPQKEDVKDAGAGSIPESGAEKHTNGENATSDQKSVEEQPEKETKSLENDTSREEKPSKRVREGQRWNERPRKYDNKHERTPFKKNYKSDLTSQEESSDPVAIRKQV